MLAAGVLAGLYVRGLALEYRASWESTFLDASVVRSIAAIAYLPGASLTGVPVPTLAEVAAIRAPAGENAARWLHLMAATVAVVVVAPRLLLALGAWLLSLNLVWGGIGQAYVAISGPTALAESVAGSSDCTDGRDYATLKALPPATVLSGINQGSPILYFTQHRVIAAPYHRNAGNIVATYPAGFLFIGQKWPSGTGVFQ
mgnify:CR=1 FL=1